MKTVDERHKQKGRALVAAALVIFALAVATVTGWVIYQRRAGNEVLTYHLLEPPNEATSAKINLDVGDGNLVVDRLSPGSYALAAGTLEYLRRQGEPARSVIWFNDQVTIALSSRGRQPSFGLPWAACIARTQWLIHLNPDVQYDITAHSGGGNATLDLAGLAVTRVSADIGGGNVALALPAPTGTLSVTAKTSAGTVNVIIPSGVAARIHATAGLGKVTVDPRFGLVDDHMYESPDFDSVADRAEIMVDSRTGSVSITTR